MASRAYHWELTPGSACFVQAGSGSEREQALQAEHAREMDTMRRMMSAERSRTKAAHSANLAMQAKQGELQEVLRSLVDRVQSQHDHEAPTEALPPVGCAFGGSPPCRQTSPVRARSASSRRRPVTAGGVIADSGRCSLDCVNSHSAMELSGEIHASGRAARYADGGRRPTSATEWSMQSAPLPLASDTRLRRPASAVDRVSHGRIRGDGRRPASAAEMPRSTRVAGGVVSVGTSWRPRSAFVARGSTPRQPLGDMLDRAMAGSRLYKSRSDVGQKAQHSGRLWPDTHDHLSQVCLPVAPFLPWFCVMQDRDVCAQCNRSWA